MLEWRLVKSIEPQMNEILRGCQDILPLESLQLFDEKELEVRAGWCVGGWRTFVL